MKLMKKNYWILGIAIIPFISLYLQQTFPAFTNSAQFVFAGINVICATWIVVYSMKSILKREKSIQFFDKFIICFGFVYLVMILLLGSSLIVSVL